MKAPREVAPGPIALFEIARREPDRVRFQVRTPSGWDPITWRRHAAAIESAASFLLDAGLAPNDRCAIFSPNRIEWLEAAFAIQAARGLLVPIYPSSTAEQARYVIEHAEVRFLFVDGVTQIERALEAAAGLAHVEAIILLGDDLEARRLIPWTEVLERGRAALDADPARVEDSLKQIQRSDPALLLYTSGTTGRPKGVPLTHDNLDRQHRATGSRRSPAVSRSRGSICCGCR